MERRVYSRLVWLVTCLTTLSFFSVLVTDLNFYLDKMKQNAAGLRASHEQETQEDGGVDPGEFSKFVAPELDENTVLNNYGDHINMKVDKNRQKNASESELKYILFWNEAYGTKEYDIGFGRQPFYDNLCPETRCFATDDRNLKPAEEFDAVFFHQRSLDFKDIPDKKKRKASQRYVHFIMESAQYLYMDIHTMDGFFNWTMTYRKDSDFYRPYGRLVQIKPHPTGEALDEYIAQFGRENKHLAAGKTKDAAWFVSHCATQARREMYVKKMKKHLNVDVYGKCGKLKCSRSNETECFLNMEKEYKFYLSFENSVCEDYVTEKFFNVMKYLVIPVTYSGTDFTAIAPPHSYINTLDYPTVTALSKRLLEVAADDELYASHFWWKDFYEVRTSRNDLSQAFCDLCAALHEDTTPKVYSDLHQWWVTQSRCKKLRIGS
eukprot:TRINITY_DN16947_c0_g1_i5.p1 TRINITY_DN16947_c0_g1~~TRINITY_DN16947_c0_g1_i5.p1  ORF type:complete len:435 (-),score=116.30 TRINITY_DN16947_c0_g1_i5:147-1451(-)